MSDGICDACRKKSASPASEPAGGVDGLTDEQAEKKLREWMARADIDSDYHKANTFLAAYKTLTGVDGPGTRERGLVMDKLREWEAEVVDRDS